VSWLSNKLSADNRIMYIAPMAVDINQIVKGLVGNEPTIINKIQLLGNMVSITYTGVNSKIQNSKVISKSDFELLKPISHEGSFKFDGDPNKFKLFAEAERINSAYQFDPLFAVNCSIVDPLPHQVEAVYKYLLPLPKIRFLLADDTGAGKTIMTGLLIKELSMRGLLERVLIVTPGGLTKQWQEDEMGLKFNLPFKLVNRAVFNSDPNVFHSSDRIVTSIDFIRNDDVLNVLRETSWDMIVVDEAHKLSAFDYGTKRYVSKRYQALYDMSQRCEHILLLTATPHRGRRDTFKNLLQLLDEDIFASDGLVTNRINEVGKTGVNKFFIRRLKEEMRDWAGKPLFKDRHTKTTLYQLTPEEKRLYDSVTDYLTTRREEATTQNNIHVSLALMVMQRRLTSSIYAIKKTLTNRYNALKGLLEELSQNPSLWKQRQKFEMEFESLDDFDEFSDEEREGLEVILSDPKKFKLFTTASSPSEIREEAEQVKALVDLADHLYGQNQEEQKYVKLKELLSSEGVFTDDEKLVLFTEHKDTLTYLETKLSNSGYKVVTIHGGKSVDERRAAQNSFSQDAQILIATDAAGEGINLQFCRLLINWDIPWNPNRLEQRMGRIHRYGQKQDVVVFNMVAQNTREGSVLQRLLEKLDLIREQMGDDRVYDVISDVFENVRLDDIINATFNGDENDYSSSIERQLTTDNVAEKISEMKERLGYSKVNYEEAQRLKEHSDEKRLQPIYVRLFFEKAFVALGGTFQQVKPFIFRITKMPDVIADRLKKDYNIAADITDLHLCFDKAVFLERYSSGVVGKLHYINPGNPVFDTLIKVVREQYREEMLKGTVLVSPEDKESYFAFYVKSQIVDNRSSKAHDSLADERLSMVFQDGNNQFHLTSPAKFLDLYAPNEFAKQVTPPDVVNNQEVIEWSFENVTMGQLEETKERVHSDADQRQEYISQAFSNIIADLTGEINDLQQKILLGNANVEEKVAAKQQRIEDLKVKREERLKNLELMKELNPKPPEVLGCAYVVPLSQVEYKTQFGMSRDDEVEQIAMDFVMDFEVKDGRTPKDVSANNEGYDIKSVSADGLKRYIEVKGRSAIGGVMLSENEMNRLSQLGDSAWLYMVMNCKSSPELFKVQNPASKLKFETKSKGIQYFLAQNEWEGKTEK
jgi:SNF2 family DNA or RNA helicase